MAISSCPLRSMCMLFFAVAGLAIASAAHELHRVLALALVVVGQRRFDGFFRQHRAVNLVGRKAVEGFHHRLIGQLERFFDRLALEKDAAQYIDRIVRIEREGQSFLLEE